MNYEALEQLTRDRRDALQQAAATHRLATAARNQRRQTRRLLAELELPLRRQRLAARLRADA